MMTLVMNGEAASIWLATMIWYTCVVFPFRQIKQSVVSLLLFGNILYDRRKEDEVVVIDDLINYSMKTSKSLPEGRFEDMEGCEEVEMCSICLVDFQNQDTVSQVSRCMHVFHAECIHKWIQRDEFTCPLCRSGLFDVDVNCPFIHST